MRAGHTLVEKYKVQTTSTLRATGDWFLLSNRNGLVLKVLHSITVGEHQDGKLVIDSPQVDEQLFTVTLDISGTLFVSNLNSFAQLEGPGEWSTNSAGFALTIGTVIHTPNNSIHVSDSLTRKRVTQSIRVKRDTAATPNRLPSNIRSGVNSESMGSFLRPSASPKRAALIKIPNDVQIEIPTLDMIMSESNSTERRNKASVAKPKARSQKPVLANAASLPDITVKEARPHKSPRIVKANQNQRLQSVPEEPRPKFRWLMFMVVVAIALVAIWYPRQFTMSEPEVIIRAPKIVLGTPSPIKPTESLQTSSTENFDEAQRSEELIFNPQPIPPDTLAETSEYDEPPQNVTELLEAARQQIDDGYITWPEQNAVTILGEVLRREPTNAEAQTLLLGCADILITEAERAFGDGFASSSEKVVLEVLDFYPNYAPALDLLRRIISDERS